MKLLSLAAAVLVTLPATACRRSSNGSETIVRPEPRMRDGGGTASLARKREAAQGEVRAALVHLQRVHFALDSARLLPASRDSLERAARGLAAHPNVVVYVEGHTDDRGTDEYNLALGERRAQVVVEYLARLGIDPARLHVITFGEERPADPGADDGARAMNRRAEFRLLRGDVELVLDAGVPYDDAGAPLDARVGMR